MQRSVKIAVIEDVSDRLIASIKQVNRLVRSKRDLVRSKRDPRDSAAIEDVWLIASIKEVPCFFLMKKMFKKKKEIVCL